MNKIKKIPQALSLIASFVIIIVSSMENTTLNVLAYRMILVALIFYIIGFFLRYFIENTYKPDLYDDIKLDQAQEVTNIDEVYQSNIENNEEFIPLNEQNLNNAEEK